MNYKKRKINKLLSIGPLMLDGGMGTLLQKKGLLPGEATENWSITHFDDIFEVHSAYFEAGSNIVLTNT
ncbi:MAG: homocysteine S-methyltransferase family protein, partial [Clostridia bacterium]|nr:homocysteine S-methyltransferase family protein [Clostridia bacterium]